VFIYIYWVKKIEVMTSDFYSIIFLMFLLVTVRSLFYVNYLEIYS